MNTKMLHDPMLYVASTLESFIFGFIESFVGIFNFHLTTNEVIIIVFLSVVGIFVSLILYAVLSSVEQSIIHEIRRDTERTMKREGYKKAKPRR